MANDNYVTLNIVSSHRLRPKQIRLLQIGLYGKPEGHVSTYGQYGSSVNYSVYVPIGRLIAIADTGLKFSIASPTRFELEVDNENNRQSIATSKEAKAIMRQYRKDHKKE